jgi:hypothetical protein
MLFLESKTLNYAVDGDARTTLLQQLQERELTPLIRSTRLRCFEDVLLNVDHVEQAEASLASATQTTIDEPYVRGDLFCFHDYILFLIFENEDTSFLRAGIVFEARTPEPFRKLDSFCEIVRALLLGQRPEMNGDFPQWELGRAVMPQGFRTFVERQDADSLYTSMRKETMSHRILAASKLEDERARVFLRTARNAHQEGYAAKLLTGASDNIPIQRLEDAGTRSADQLPQERARVVPSAKRSRARRRHGQRRDVQ